MYFTDIFLGYEFHNYGLEVFMTRWDSIVQDEGINPMDKAFPKVTLKNELLKKISGVNISRKNEMSNENCFRSQSARSIRLECPAPMSRLTPCASSPRTTSTRKSTSSSGSGSLLWPV